MNKTIAMEALPAPLLADLLHAMGQPLTVLQMSVLLRDRRASANLLADELLADMADQVALLTRLFTSLRNLLEVGTTPAVPPSTMETLVQKLLPRWRSAASVRNVNLTVLPGPHSARPPQRLGGNHPWDICLQDIFDAALLSVPENGEITLEVVAAPDAGCILKVLGGHLLPETSFPERFSLPVASALFHAVGQQFTYSLRPFAVKVSLRPEVTSTTSLPKPPFHSPISHLGREEDHNGLGH